MTCDLSKIPALNCSMGREGGTHSTSAQCSGKQITRGNTKRCDTGNNLAFHEIVDQSRPPQP